MPIIPKRTFSGLFETELGESDKAFYNRYLRKSYNDYKLMYCSGENLQIHYQIEDKSKPEQVFDCKDKTPDYFFEQKYLKYKQKYLQLKKSLNIN